MDTILNNRGRPVGYKLSDESKDKIRQKRLGSFHSEETKRKISISLSMYFRGRDPLVNSLNSDYRHSDDMCEWINTNKDPLNSCDNVLTNKRIIYMSQIEHALGDDIDKYFGHNLTPEFIVLLKEELTLLGLNSEVNCIDSIL